MGIPIHMLFFFFCTFSFFSPFFSPLDLEILVEDRRFLIHQSNNLFQYNIILTLHWNIILYTI